MTQFQPDVFIVLEYNINEPLKSTIKANANQEGVREILEAWVHTQLGAGPDPREAVPRDVYTIKIGLRLEDDAFGTESDTNNKGLTCGIVLDALRHFDQLQVQDL